MTMASSPPIAEVLSGLADLHCHSGPSPFAREFDHVEGAKDGGRLQMRAMLVKSHHHNTVMDLLAMKGRLADVRTEVFGGIALNAQVGGINPYAVAMCLRMGGRAVWFPTFSSQRHLDAHPEGTGFPTATVELPSRIVPMRDESGKFLPEVHEVLDLVHENEAIVSGGHGHPEDIRELFTHAQARGIERMVINHPNFVIGADPELCHEFTRMGAFVEHEVGMYDPLGNKKWDPALLLDWIRRIGPEHTVLASDLGQIGRPMPVDAFTRVGQALLDLGLPPADLRRMVRDNPLFLLRVSD
ncbi:DUF6282 family protein [Streptomyces rapamycinicus]|uniref:Amidohydrolase-related domain-containing protein n=2 Tax=Streptomyces rapamycinicus TaxID=1226757 RepID=A0A0A0NVC1_STRRN|nr:DUF6282 family protein [Streptomyces rapamycinicus]AGP60598.1 hypothetical protein M271_46165 [Streptomyces rapamycinicus NRRL 5491]MBB4788234.1 hypothetical protein [Streptomyces rapamycinicus]RLV72569.1 hypothetical protein D3C57_148620 [Streptomyces rapamycinicus NRRL 5491]UTP36153.1 DUF6282 family protein [Streptomyces rapamycinicus NRRL 5491]